MSTSNQFDLETIASTGIGSVLLSSVGPTFLAIIFFQGWVFVFATAFSYVIFDASIGLFIGRFRNSLRIRILGPRFRPRGIVFLVFLFIVIIGIGGGSSFFSEKIAGLTGSNPLGLFGLNVLACSLVYIDMVLRTEP